MLQQQLEKAGFTVKLEVREYSRLESDALAGQVRRRRRRPQHPRSTPATPSPSSPATSPATAATTSPCCATRTSTGPSPRPTGVADTAERQDAAMAAEAAILAHRRRRPAGPPAGHHRRRHLGAGRAPRPVRAHPRRHRNAALTACADRATPRARSALGGAALAARPAVCGIGLLPWLSRTDPALTVLKARSADRDPTPEVLAAIRARTRPGRGPVARCSDSGSAGCRTGTRAGPGSPATRSRPPSPRPSGSPCC